MPETRMATAANQGKNDLIVDFCCLFRPKYVESLRGKIIGTTGHLPAKRSEQW